ncbi:MAG: 23S rRNA (uracil(1939)-C(5))-methyltransferase RlmD [Candidatus Cloacimonetes bacterium]|nr:23S rRNA (uracil(1939)-C(5))-methyltransferase RlmD [Candidatus Cloacimonadota bacterium]MCF7813943.1 23S rRNA (uracil(1939)-C(5))-methyltransferase RlmD [Candidatus Cloacimonadota bacterium]MCF7868037.1 23S rRNA (uracil(1939)-C(5))-methyltransferase RlmD [Candidatus Cloacimonadota bacterium]
MNELKNLKIEKLVYKGYGLGFNDSQPVFVTCGLPEDILNVKTEFKKGKNLFASVKEIIKPSPFRRNADCEVFGTCGGCDWLNLEYSKQLHFKQQIIDEIFYNVPIKKKLPIIGSKKINYYRNKSFFPVASQTGKPVIGMFAKRSHEVIPHENCKLHPKLFDDVSKVFMEYVTASKIKIYDEKTGKGSLRHLGMRYSQKTDELIVVVVSKNRKVPFTNQLVRVLKENFSNLVGVVLNINPNRTNVILDDGEKILFGRDYIFEEVNGKKFKLNYKSFFQVNSEIAAEMYEFVKQQLVNSQNIVDAYCGVGSIGIYVKSVGQKLWGIENNENAILDAEENAKLNNIMDANFICGNVEEELEKIDHKIDTVIFDPPRKGLERSIIEKLDDSIIKIVYISCDPNTQKRDVKMILQKGFKVNLMQSFDMFPHTFHIENVMVLER